ncbi:metallo-beta-lactamase [Ignicoccus pacificus DSM 13166]|uniref:Metallo-beta-lactamase n=1 Tax=Ignicoccus pacificus DSM 13166 TaxID=940294 RepID=A0A977KA15_9CREN|nr:metallo-beta-lactamase [Ignicoccus pacificus DSM 13166]
MLKLTPQDHEKVKAGEVEVVKLLADPIGVEEKYIMAYIAIGKNSRVLIETGPKKSFDRLKESLKEVGIEMREIDAVFLTHIHLDHAGGAGLVAKECNCPVYVHPRGLPHLIDPSKLNAAAERTLGEFVFNAYGPAEPLPEEFARSTEEKVYSIGDVNVKVIFTPGHAPHHQAILINGVLFPGDALGEVTVWRGSYSPTTPHRTLPPMIIDSIRKLMFEKVNSIAYTHRGIIIGKEEALKQMHGEIEQIRTWLEVARIHSKECKLDVECYKKYLLLADPLYKDLMESGELEKSKLLQNSIRMSIDGIARYVQGIK